MRCSSCDKQRAELHPRKSRLLGSLTLFLCNDCTRAKMEPRYLIIMYGRRHGAEAVSDYIKNHRYVGEDILAKELVG